MASKAFNMVVLAIIIAAIGTAVYALTDINRVVVNGAPEQYAIYKPGETKQSYEELIAINPEVIGWIEVYGTKIDYPVTQAKDNDKYLMLGPDLKYSLLGSIFLDAGNAPDFSDFCSVLYGHNMTPRAMFGNIKDFRDEAYFEAHKYGDLFYEGTHHGLEIFAVFAEDGYSHFLKQLKLTGREEKQRYLDQIYEKSVWSRDIGVTPDDRIVMMYTCSNVETNGRDLLVARITDRTFENTFAEEERGQSAFTEAVKKIPLWLWPFLILLLLLLLLALLKRREKAKKKRAVAAEIKADSMEQEKESKIKQESSEKQP